MVWNTRFTNPWKAYILQANSPCIKVVFLKTYVKRILWSTYLLPSSQATAFESVFYSLHRYGRSRGRTQIPWLATMMIYKTFVLRMLLEVYVKRALMNKVKHLVILDSYVYHTLYVRLTAFLMHVLRMLHRFPVKFISFQVLNGYDISTKPAFLAADSYNS